LFIDAGNSRLKLRMGRHGTVHHIDWRGMDEPVLSDAFKAILAEQSVPATVVFCAAIPESRQRLLGEVVSAALPEARQQWLKVHRRKGGVRPAYHDAASFGVDRYLALVAARAKYRNRPVVVIDMGTAVTIDAMDQGGRHLGGLILPGLGGMRDSLFERAPHLLEIPPDPDHDAPAEAIMPVNTRDAIEVGVHALLTGGIERILTDLAVQMSSEPEWLVCGGNADVLCSLTELPLRRDPALVLDGMVLAASRT